MSTETIFYFSIAVFTLMLTGIVLTALEFQKMARESAARKGPDPRD